MLSKTKLQDAKAEVEQIQAHLKRIRARKNYPHLHVFVNPRGRVIVLYRPPGGKAREIFSHPQRQAKKFHDEYWQIGDGPTGPGGGLPQDYGSHKSGTVNAALDKLVESSEYPTNPNTVKAYNYSIAALREAFGGTLFCKLRPANWWNYVDQRKVGGLDVVNLITVMRKLQKVANREEWKDPQLDLMKDIQNVSLTKEEKKARGYKPWRIDQVEQWRDYWAGQLMQMLTIELGYHGFPRSDIIRLAPCHIGVNERGEVCIEAGFSRRKTGEQYSGICSKELVALFAEHARRYPMQEGEVVDIKGRSTTPFLRKSKGASKDQPFVAAQVAAEPQKFADEMQAGAQYFGGVFARWRNQAGLPLDFNLHGGRETVAVDADEAEIIGKDAMRVLGQSREDTFDHYRRQRDIKLAGERASRSLIAAREEKVAAYRGRKAAAV